jgi:hypothetical protein
MHCMFRQGFQVDAIKAQYCGINVQYLENQRDLYLRLGRNAEYEDGWVDCREQHRCVIRALVVSIWNFIYYIHTLGYMEYLKRTR